MLERSTRRTRLSRAVRILALPILLVVIGAGSGCGGDSPSTPDKSSGAASASIPFYRHVVLAIFENRQQPQIIGSSDASYLTGLSKRGANFTRSFAVEHPSQPNYLDLFSGSNQGLTNDSCPHSYEADNLASQLDSAGMSFVGYSEGLPEAGSTACVSGGYARKHAPWANFTNLDQGQVGKPLTDFPQNFDELPQVSWVVPNLCNDMHDCPVATGDAWAREHLGPYERWAKRNESLMIVTFDEDDYTGSNRIATVFAGARVKSGDFSEPIDHFTVLRTIEDIFGLSPLGGAAEQSPITSAFD